MQHIAGQHFLNHLLEPEELRRQIREFANAGYESLYAHARAGLLTPYLSEAWVQAVDTMADEARKCGITLSIWDEDYYPSATAGGRVVWENPSYMAQDLIFTVMRVKAGETLDQLLPRDCGVINCYAIPSNGGEPVDITAYTGTVKSDWWRLSYVHQPYSLCDKIGSPHLRAGLNYKQCAVLWTAPADSDYTVVACQLRRRSDGHGTDLLNPDAMDCFIDVTHEQYLKRYGKNFSDIFSATFLDEPAPSGPFQWTTAFPEEFKKDHGFDILPKLPHLAVDIDDTSRFIRHCYRTTQHRLICDNYLKRIMDWDRAHGIKSVGHLTRTEYFSFTLFAWPDEVRCYKYLDIPCTDPLGFFVALPDACAYHTGLKVTSSAARLFNKEQCGSDALAVMGNEVALRDLVYQTDFQTTFGVTYYNIHGLNYSLDGPRKEETPPSLFYQHSEWPIMKHFIKPLQEKCATVASGVPCERLAVLYPSTSLYCHYNAEKRNLVPQESQFHKLSERLLSHQKDYDFVDEITLAERDGKSWRKDYDAIILYKTTEIGGAAADAIEDFKANGGRVVLIADELPVVLRSLNQPAVPWTALANDIHADLDDALLASLPGIDVTSDDNPASARDIFIQERDYNGTRRILAFNRAPQPFRGRIAGKDVVIPPGVAAFTDECAPKKLPQKVDDISNGWQLAFPDNSLPLAFWVVPRTDSAPGTANMLMHQFTNMPDDHDHVVYENYLLLRGKPSHAKLVLEKSTFDSPDWQIFVNDIEIPRESFKQELVVDCLNITADITAMLRGGNSPLKNVIKIACNSRECRLQEMPFIVGDFSAEFRHGLPSLPDLWADEPQPIALNGLPDWRTVGRGSFSGHAVYTRTVTLESAGRYLLDCGRVEDAVELYIDGQFVAACLTPFYRFEFDAAAGSHIIELRVWNGPGNRDRLSSLPAGLLGPVTIGKLQ